MGRGVYLTLGFLLNTIVLYSSSSFSRVSPYFPQMSLDLVPLGCGTEGDVSSSIPPFALPHSPGFPLMNILQNGFGHFPHVLPYM